MHSKTVPRIHDVKIWKRIVEAFGSVGVKGTPTAIAKELGMAQPSVRQWSLGETTPNRANVLAVAKKTGYLSWYIEEGKLPKKAPQAADRDDPLGEELMEVWGQLSGVSRARLVERAHAILASQLPEPKDSSELQRRRS